MAFVILLIVLLVLGWLTFMIVGSVVGLVLTLLVAGVIGWLADLVVPGELPGGWVGAVIAGLVGGFIGRALFHWLNWGTGFPVFGVDVIPAFVGAVIVAVAAELLTNSRRRRFA